MHLEPFAPVFACFSLYCMFETWPNGQVFLVSSSGDAGRQIVSNLGLPDVPEGLRAPLRWGSYAVRQFECHMIQFVKPGGGSKL